MYKINEVAKLSGLTVRTLQYYDKIGLLVPETDPNNQYRIYNDKDIELLQVILFYKELDYSLEEIKKIVSMDEFKVIEVLQSQLHSLQKKKEKLNRIIDTIEETILHKESDLEMDNDKKFEAFKEKLIEENDSKYGEELQEKYDDSFVSQSYDQLKRKSKYQMKQQEELNEALNQITKEATKQNNPSSESAQKMCEMHKEWLMFYWPSYSLEAHLELVKMYTQDDRFKSYYDKIEPGSADFLYQAMLVYTNKKRQ
jgi:DNA-binding transcriptional MerR regulator